LQDGRKQYYEFILFVCLSAFISPYCGFHLQAYELQQAGKQYIVKDNKIVLVDENTGRLKPSTRYQDGMHQVSACCLSMFAASRGGGYLI
jgi:hypothetical protein